ncbi:hypothetical protein EKK58_10725 [Candidatus Dependentiae bacterium]|nr:MAG: hypothetical protein EKK58_10725 [Candidatus Dependentiae bacterium]
MFNKKILFVFFIFCSINAKIDRIYVQQHTKKFKAYLKDLKNSMSLPTFVIRNSMKALGYSSEEINAVPAAYPFIYEEKYKEVLPNLNDDLFIQEANKLIDTINPLFDQNLTKQARRQKAHELIHKWNCENMGLPIGTTTEQLALLVEKKQINLPLFLHYQLIQFFVKYHLDIN